MALFAALTAISGLVANRVLTQVVAPAPLGALYLLTNVGLWITLPTASGYVFIGRHWPVARAHSSTTYLIRGITHGLFLQFILATLGATFCNRWGVVGSLGVIAMLLFCVGQSVVQALSPIPAMERRRYVTGILDLLNGPGRAIAIAAGAWAIGSPTADHLLLFQGIQAVLVAALYIIVVAVIAKRIRGEQTEQRYRPQSLSLRAFLSYSIPFFATAALAQLSVSAERWGLASLADTSATALFVQSMGLSLATVNACTGFLNVYFYPVITQASTRGASPFDGASRPIRRYLLTTSLILVALVFAGFLLRYQAASRLFGPRFSSVSTLLPWTTLGAALFALGQALTIVSYVARDPLGPNIARGLAMAFYSITLLAYRPATDPARSFAKVYVLGQVIFVIAVMSTATFLIGRVRRTQNRV